MLGRLMNEIFGFKLNQDRAGAFLGNGQGWRGPPLNLIGHPRCHPIWLSAQEEVGLFDE